MTRSESFPLADEKAGVHLGAVLDDRVEDLDAGGAAEFPELGEEASLSEKGFVSTRTRMARSTASTLRVFCRWANSPSRAAMKAVKSSSISAGRWGSSVCQ